MKTSDIAELGLVSTFQATTLFHEFTVFDNVLVGCHLQARIDPFSVVFGLKRQREARARAKVEEILDFMDLADAHGRAVLQPAARLAARAGHRRRARHRAQAPDAGRALHRHEPEETRRMMELIRQVRDTGVTILLVEHDMQAVMGLCDKITVLNFGSLLAEGEPEAIRANPEVDRGLSGRR